jgi:hypothetical protein
VSAAITIGTVAGSREKAHLDVQRLVDTRLLVQANSGGGKSWCLRRILEQTHGQLQHLVIDPEGEFATLRERFDYVLAARNGGDTVADPRAARLLAERLLELGVSAVLDIYELKAHDRIRFVRYFLEALVDAPKKLWHPALVVVDEAHVYCPQAGEAESAQAVIDLATRGRKRGFCAALATQRLSKLHKDAAAELNNKLIGRTGLDVDVKRAADELGFAKERWRELRDLPEGHFFAYGPAISREVVAVHVGEVLTTHPKAGGRLAAAAAPPPTDKVRALLPKLADLPAEAEQRQRTNEDLKKQVLDLQRQLRARPTEQVERAVTKRVEIPVLKDAQIKRLEVAVERLLGEMARVADVLAQRQQVVVGEAGLLRTALEAAVAAQNRAPVVPAGAVGTGRSLSPSGQGSRPAPVVHRAPLAPRREAPAGNGDGRIGKGEVKVLTAIAQHPAGVTREQITVLTGYKRSSRDTYLQRLRSGGYIEDGETIRATAEGVDLLGSDFEPLPTGEALRDYWRGKLPAGEKKILEPILEAYPEWVSRDALQDVGFARSSRDTYLQRLSARQLIKTDRGQVRAADHLFAGA